jgi:hypothetical protein
MGLGSGKTYPGSRIQIRTTGSNSIQDEGGGGGELITLGIEDSVRALVKEEHLLAGSVLLLGCEPVGEQLPAALVGGLDRELAEQAGVRPGVIPHQQFLKYE